MLYFNSTNGYEIISGNGALSYLQALGLLEVPGLVVSEYQKIRGPPTDLQSNVINKLY